VTVTEYVFSPSLPRLQRGGYLIWDFDGAYEHRVVDASGMDLFDTGAMSTGSAWHRFVAAGTYPFRCTIHPTMHGKLRVELRVAPRTGTRSTTFTVTWASRSAPSGFVYDVQILRPGASRWADWRHGAVKRSAPFGPVHQPGTYRFRSRLRLQGSGEASGWSEPKRLRVA
jgi:hypothetical protein